MWSSSARLGLVMLVVATLPAGSGCSQGGPSTAPVTGRVTLKGQPLADIYVYFQPISTLASSGSGKRPPEPGAGSYGLTDGEGNFVLRLSDTDEEGAVVGTHKVRLSDKRAEDPEDADAGEITAPPSRIPAEFARRELTFEVKPEGENQASFELSAQ